MTAGGSDTTGSGDTRGSEARTPAIGADATRGLWRSPPVVQVADLSGRVAGAGFLAADGLVVTCVHVLPSGSALGDRVEVRFPHLPQTPVVGARVEVVAEAADVAALHLDRVPEGTAPAGLGAAAGCRGHRVSSYGFPAQAPRQGHFGYGTAGDLLPDSESGALLQLTGANDLTAGFSGGPVVDEVTGLVIGMVTAITAADTYQRGTGVAYAVPAEVLRETVPGLAEQQVTPYRGLEPFTTADAAWFHGRHEAVETVVEALRRHQLVLLLGPSGAGKSSLVQAGVIPALKNGLPGSDRWLPVTVRPGRNLVAGLTEAGLPGADGGIGAAVNRLLEAEPDHDRVVLVVDQFEELLTHPGTGASPDGGLALVGDLAELIEAHPTVSVIVVMRNDFYPRLAEAHPELLDAFVRGSVNIPARLTSGELGAIITRPAHDAGARFEDGLPERIIDDLRAADPGHRTPATLLPPLQLALSQLWDRRAYGRLTHDAYQRIGAVTGSLASWGSSAIAELPPARRATARRILTALVQPPDDAAALPAVRRQVGLARLRELATGPPGDGPAPVFDEIVSALSRARIITTATDPHTGEAVAELIHDALVRDWGELREWAALDQRFQLWLHRTTEQADRHKASGLPGDLLAGTGLAEGQDWARQRRLPADISAFLTASSDHRQATLLRARRLNTVLASLLSLALIASGLAAWQWQNALDAQHMAQSRQLAAESDDLLSTDLDLAALLAVQAYDRLSPTLEARASLLSAAGRGASRSFDTGAHAETPFSVALSEDGGLLAIASGDATVGLWDTATGKELHTLATREGTVDHLVLSPNGQTLAATGAHNEDGTVQLWDTATGEEFHTLTEHEGTVKWMALTPDGQTLATASNDETLRLWDTATGKELHTLTGRGEFVDYVAFSPDGQTLAAGVNESVRLWDTATGNELRTLTGHDDMVSHVAFSPDGQTLATASLDESTRLWDTATGKELRTLVENNSTFRVVFSPGGQTVAILDNGGSVGLWGTDTGNELHALTGHDDMVRHVAFSPDGQTLATASLDGTVRLRDTATGGALDTFVGDDVAMEWVAFGPDAQSPVSLDEDGMVRVWETDSSRELATLTWPDRNVYQVAFSPDGQTLAAGGLDTEVRLWDTATHRQRDTFTGHDGSVNGVAFAPDGQTLATASLDGTVRLWETATSKELHTLAGHEASVNGVAFAPDGQTLATASDDETVRLWDTATGNGLRTLTGHGDMVYHAAFSPDGQTLATAGLNDAVRLWDTATGNGLRTLAGHEASVNGVAFAPEGQLATASDDGTVRLWDTATGRQHHILTGHEGPVNGVAFTPNGQTLATASDDGTVRLWDTATGRQRHILTGHESGPDAVAFAPDGQSLATASSTTVGLWNAELAGPDGAVEQICRSLQRDFTPSERAQYLRGIEDDGPVCPP